jgi:hypothetical protein
MIYFLFFILFQDQSINPKHIAIDKPSFKFSSFLNKYYNLKAVVPQVNELTALVVIGTDCTGSCKSNYYTITITALSA